MAIGWEHVAILLLGMNTLLFGELFRRIMNIEKKLDEKIDKDNYIVKYKEIVDMISKEIDYMKSRDEKLWGAFNKHTHIGVEGNGRVIRQ